MKPLRKALVVVATAALSVAIAVALVAAPSGGYIEAPFMWLALAVIAAWSYVGVGLFTSARRPANRVGLLISTIGFAAFLGALRAVDVPGIFIVSVLGSHVMPVLLGHLLMVYPSGRFESKLQRNITALAYFDASVLAVLAVLVLDTKLHCVDCPRNPLLLDANNGLQQAISVARLTLDGFATIGLAVMLTRRWYSAAPTQRAILSPVYWTGGATLVAFFVVLVSEFSAAPGEILGASMLGALAVSATVPWTLAFGFARDRFTRAGAIGDLVATLTSQQNLETELRDALALGLEDPSLELAYWLPHRQCYVDADGQVINPPDSRSNRHWHSVELNGELIAAIIYDGTIGNQSELIRVAGGAAALTLKNQGLEAELRAHVKELHSSRARLVEATDAERQRIERDLHDGGQQQLLSIALHLNLAGMKMNDDPAGAAAMFKIAAAELTHVTEELRDLARGIHPAILNDRGLSGALTALADRSPMRVDLVAVPNGPLPATIESTAYFVVAEGLANVIRHAHATGVSVSVVDDGDLVTIEISDDGVGGASPRLGTGLIGLADRVSALDGNLRVVSPAGEGTIVRAVLPLYPVETGLAASTKTVLQHDERDLPPSSISSAGEQ